MELGGREILIGLGVLLVIAILLDGFRRSRGSSGELRVRRRRQPIFDDDGFDDHNSELPGKARVVEVRDEQSADRLSRVMKQNAAKNQNKLTMPFREPEQASLSLDDAEAALSADDNETLNAENSPAVEYEIEQNQDSELDPPEQSESVEDYDGSGVEVDDSDDAEVGEQDFIVLHLMASLGEQFPGGPLLEVLLDKGLRYGSQKIFHRHEHEDGSGNVLFSVTNSVNPGTFELNEMASFSSPGLTFFMVMQDSDDPMAAFELLLGTVDGIKKELGGELKDADRSALTRQTAEHYREQIMDYNRRQLAS
ncbi:MAG: cell division protein ZipA [Porticoccaceae bacterium]|nr:cell division protein ZipA [Porticoccaceae bacterium]